MEDYNLVEYEFDGKKGIVKVCKEINAESEIKEAKELSAEEKKICGPFLLFWPKNEEQQYHIL